MSALSIFDKWGKKRKATEFVCEYCKEKVIRRIFSNRPNKYCSQRCAWNARLKRGIITCLNCNKSFERRLSGIKKLNFCNRICKEKYQSGERHPNWKGGLGTYREQAINKFGLKCQNAKKCPLNFIKLPSFMYEVDHIDSDRKNNTLENLQVLCVWCHRVKTYNYGVVAQW